MTLEKLAAKVNPHTLSYSPKMAAIVGALIGFDYGARDSRGGKLGSISITSDGFVVASSTSSDGGGAFIGSADDLRDNLARLLNDASLTVAERKQFDKLVNSRLSNWSSQSIL